MTGSDNNATSKTVFLGNVPTDIHPKLIFDSIGRPGPIEALRILPLKRCAFLDFVNEQDAVNFLSTKKIITLREKINEQTIILAVKPAKASLTAAPLKSAIRCGATRNIYLGGWHNSEVELRKTVEATGGDIDTIKVFEERNLAFVHLTSISQAIKTINDLEKKYPAVKINYGDDRCSNHANSKKRPSINNTESVNVQRDGEDGEDGELINEPNNKREKKDHNTDNSKDSGEKHKRTIFLSGIHPDTTLEDLCNVIRGGNLESIRLLKEKNTAFISFVEAEAATNFYEHASTKGLFIRGDVVKRVSWADVRILSSTLQMALKKGATRTLYLGNLDPSAFSKERLREIGEAFGVVESARLIRDKNNSSTTCKAFISFGELKDAVLAVQVLQSDESYKECRIGYGKDRCCEVLPTGKPMGFNTFITSSMTNNHNASFEREDIFTSIENRLEINK